MESLQPLRCILTGAGGNSWGGSSRGDKQEGEAFTLPPLRAAGTVTDQHGLGIGARSFFGVRAHLHPPPLSSWKTLEFALLVPGKLPGPFRAKETEEKGLPLHGLGRATAECHWPSPPTAAGQKMPLTCSTQGWRVLQTTPVLGAPERSLLEAGRHRTQCSF